MSGGFIKINRQITDWRWWGNPNAMAIWLYILVNANWADGYWHQGDIVVHRGELATSQATMAKELKLNRRTVHRYLVEFEKAGQITMTVHSKLTLIKVLKYDTYQG